MANDYYVDMTIEGRKKSIDELEKILQQEIDEGHTWEHYYTMHKSIERMGFDPDKVEDIRAYTNEVQRLDDTTLSVHYVGAWSVQSGIIKCIHKRWPDLSISWEGVDQFGQYPRTTEKELVGKYRIEDKDEGVNPFSMLGYWVGEEAVPTINAYYHTNCKTLQDCFKNIPNLLHSEQMQLCAKDEMNQ